MLMYSNKEIGAGGGGDKLEAIKICLKQKSHWLN